MIKGAAKTQTPDQAERNTALDPRRSVLVRAPAGSGKTTLLTERFLRLLAEVDDPGQVVAITFTEAAAAEMRSRVLDKLREDEPGPEAKRALENSERLGWKLLESPAQLRIQTIDSFCRDLALQQPLVSGLGGGLEVAEQPGELYCRAARRTLEQIDGQDADLSVAIERLLLWRDNNWEEIENLLAEMLKNRDRWMKEFVLARDPNWDWLRQSLERALARDGGDSASARYTELEWEIVQASFKLLRRAVGELRVVFCETGRVDFTEVSQIALSVLKGADEQADEAVFAVADGIRHLLVDEFQDTSRRQHQLLSNLVRAWPDREYRSTFVVGDPMQSIYSFRDADAELFHRVEHLGLEIPGDQPLRFEPVQLTANFRSAGRLVEHINEFFAHVFAEDDGSRVQFTAAVPARDDPPTAGLHPVAASGQHMQLHVEFMPKTSRGSQKEEDTAQRETARQIQVRQIVELIQEHLPRMERARAAGEKYRIAVLGRTRKVLAPIAQALRESGINFRAVKLEELKDRPEIIDALALARALFDPEDRAAWLGVLRAPWSGLSLADLHLLVSADEKELNSQPVPELLRARAQLLSGEGRAAAQRVAGALEFAQRLRLAQPAMRPGTWLEQVWLELGGAQCVDAAARANLDLLWSSIDSLPDGEADLLEPALDAAIKDLKAQPDPEADSDCGVQLMTIHGSKGLEFEVVIVPELQASGGSAPRELLSWLERGLIDDDGRSEVTEFLVAPLQPKGDERGKAKEFVDRSRRDREKQELRRLLYVAATRAREELHFFTRVEFKTEKNGTLALATPSNSLLAMAWPAFEAEIRRRLDAWREAIGEELVDIAAQQETPQTTCRGNQAAMLRRLPADFSATREPALGTFEEPPLLGNNRLYERHEGGLLPRSLGRAAHLLLQELSQLMAAHSRQDALAALHGILPWVTAQIRSAGVDRKQADRIAKEALDLAARASADPAGKWILAPHADASSEIRWTGVVDGKLRTVQVDRVFRAGAAPGTDTQPGEAGTWWIIDYKTAYQEGASGEAVLPGLRRIFAPQIEAYAKVLRNLQGHGAAIRGGLYYPRMGLFDWWEL